MKLSHYKHFVREVGDKCKECKTELEIKSLGREYIEAVCLNNECKEHQEPKMNLFN